MTAAPQAGEFGYGMGAAERGLKGCTFESESIEMLTQKSALAARHDGNTNDELTHGAIGIAAFGRSVAE